MGFGWLATRVTALGAEQWGLPGFEGEAAFGTRASLSREVYLDFG